MAKAKKKKITASNLLVRKEFSLEDQVKISNTFNFGEVKIERLPRDSTVKNNPSKKQVEPRDYWFFVTHVETGCRSGTQNLCRTRAANELTHTLHQLEGYVQRYYDQEQLLTP